MLDRPPWRVLKKVAVEVNRHGAAGVPEETLDGPQIGSGRDEERCRCVAEIVDPGAAESRPFERFVPIFAKAEVRVLVQMAPVGDGKR